MTHEVKGTLDTVRATARAYTRMTWAYETAPNRWTVTFNPYHAMQAVHAGYAVLTIKRT